MARWILLLICLTCGLPAMASRVVKINPGPPFHLILDNRPPEQYEIHQELCVKYAEHRAICGLVFARKGKYSALRFRPGFGRFISKIKLPAEALPPDNLKSRKVALIRSWQRTPGRALASEVDGNIVQFEGDPGWDKRQKVGWPRAIDDGFHPSNHISLGVSYLSPFMKYEVAIGKRWSLGLKMQYQYLGINGGNLSGYGGMFGVHYYGIREFKGLWLHMAGGFYSLQAKVGSQAGNFSTPAFGFMAGWKWSWKNNFSFGFGFGSEFLFKTEPAGFSPSFNGALPVVLIDFGIVF